MKTLRVFRFIGFGILGVAFIVLVIFGVQALWNWLIPQLFNGPVLNFWQTVGLFFLSKILLTGVAPGPQHDNKRDWKKKFRDKCIQASKDEQAATTAGQI